MGVVPDARDLPPGSQPWKRWVDNQLATQETSISRADQNLANTISALANTVKLLGDQITALPVQVVLGNLQDGFALDGTWTSHAKVSFVVPANKPHAQVFASVNAAVLDTVSGGLTNAEGRINFGGVLSHIYSASKDSGASAVNNVINGSHFYTVNLIPGLRYSLNFELRGLNPTAFPEEKQNYANLNVIITHTG